MIKNHAQYLKAILFPNNLAEVGSSVVQSVLYRSRLPLSLLP